MIDEVFVIQECEHLMTAFALTPTTDAGDYPRIAS